jgi:hypothetical protein
MGGQPPLLPCTVVADHAFGVGSRRWLQRPNLKSIRVMPSQSRMLVSVDVRTW